MAWGNRQGVGRSIDPTHWSYSGDPRTSAKDRVRFIVGDVDGDDPLVSDPEVLSALEDEGNDARKAAAACLEFLANHFAVEADKAVGNDRMALSQRSEACAKRAAELRERAVAQKATSLAMPYVGGIDKAEKCANAADPDRVKPFFTRDRDTIFGDCDAED